MSSSAPVPLSDHQVPKVRRPWGYFEVLSWCETCCVKRIVVHADSRLSLQRHRMRAEHWYVVDGVADVQIDDRFVRLLTGQAVDIPQLSWHRLGNSSSAPLILLEIQTGSSCTEGDIERAEDDYDRVTPAHHASRC